MNLSRSLEQAQRASTQHAAVKLYHDTEFELELGHPTPEDARQARDALALLRERFPGVENEAYEVTTPPKLSRRANKTLADEAEEVARTPLHARPRERVRAEARAGGGARARAGRATAIYARPRRRRSGGGQVFGARPAQAAGGVAREVIWAVEGVVGLVLLGLLVSPNGSQAFSGAFGWLGVLLGKLANPSDTLFHASGGHGGGSNNPPFVGKYSRKKPPPAPPGAKHTVPRPRPFLPAPLSPWNDPLGTGSGAGVPEPVPVG